jgi:SAM-dependent MidA family methyltransferase
MLEKSLKEAIKKSGPISIAHYWERCLFDHQFGYYMTQEPFGVLGDFITAPEISQMFGEILASWWLYTVRHNGLENIALVEIGPGRGTLMLDMLRTLAKLDQNAFKKYDVHMIETSDRLQAVQYDALKSTQFSIQWHKSVDTLPKKPIVIIGNELFDAIPVDQYVKTPSGWCKRVIGLDEHDNFCFYVSDVELNHSCLPKKHEAQKLGAIFEYAPERTAVMKNIARHIEHYNGFGLFIDYGHRDQGFGDTIQALKKHKFISMLKDQGYADISSHVDFCALRQAAGTLNLYHIIEQGEFLISLGLKERMDSLISLKPDMQKTFQDAFNRLTDCDQMGKLFKVFGLAHSHLTLPALVSLRD